MVNDPLPGQLTVGQLRQSLEEIPDGVVVGLLVPPGDSLLTVCYNLRVQYQSGVALLLVPNMESANAPIDG
jgi:hypothetical protein